MRRLVGIILVIGLLLVGVPAAFAQDTAAEAEPTPIAQDELNEIIQQVTTAGEEARYEFDRAVNILGIFEGVGLVVSIMTILGTILAVVGGFVGFKGLNDARAQVDETRENVKKDLGEARQRVQEELAEAQKRFSEEMDAREAQLDAIREELRHTIEEQREKAAKANLAMSFMPLGERQYRSQDFSGAINTYHRALELDPSNLIACYRLGYVYTQSGQLDEAQKFLNEALEIEEDFAPALAALGYVYRRLGEKMSDGTERNQTLNQAESYLLQALTASPKLVDDDGESWWGSLGGLYRRRGQITEAIYAYEQAADITPQSSYAFSNLALLYLQTKNKSAMIQTYERVEQLAQGEVQADVDNYWAYADLLTSRLALGKIESAQETLVSVLHVAPSEGPYVFEILVDTLERLVQALGEKNAGHVREVIDAINAYIAQRKAEPASD
ncbi:MAG: tetratricopeptide repeat protein [Anaerolineaceae bacterium]|nr:tetratricopeptide repeat protein [Anaerolineaceae bacterium]